MSIYKKLKIIFIIVVTSIILFFIGLYSIKDTAYWQYYSGKSYFTLGQMGPAKECFKQAVAKGHIDSIGALGLLLLKEGDIEGAKKQLETAAIQGSATGKLHLALTFLQTGENLEISKNLLEEAATQGEIRAIGFLGLLYFDQGDFSKAEDLFNKGVKLGSDIAQFGLAKLYKKRGETDKAIVMLEKAANQGLGIAQNDLGIIYCLEGNLAKAQEWLEKAETQGCPDAQLYLGVIYAEKGYFIKAKEKFDKAAMLLGLDKQELINEIRASFKDKFDNAKK